MKTALIYGTTTGNTEHVASLIAEALKPEIEVECVDVFKIAAANLNDWDLVICGIPTWDVGELEYGWSDLYDHLDEVELDVTVTMFGLGDQVCYAETYQDAMGILYRKLVERGATGQLGFTPIGEHAFEESIAIIDGQFCGLALDEDSQPELTDSRIAAWAAEVKSGLPKITEKIAAQQQ